MLRALVAVIVLANVVYFGFTRGWFDGVAGLHAEGDREPERLAAQVRPNAVVILPMASSPASRAVTCLEAGPISAADSLAALAAVQAILPLGGYVDIRSEAPGGPPTVVTHVYRVASADAATAARLTALRLDAAGHGFSACVASR